MGGGEGGLEGVGELADVEIGLGHGNARGVGWGGGVTSDIAKRGLLELRSSMRPLRSCSMNSITMKTSSSFLPTTTYTVSHR